MPPHPSTGCGSHVCVANTYKLRNTACVPRTGSKRRGSFSSVVRRTGHYRPPMTVRGNGVVNKFTRTRIVTLTNGIMRTIGDKTVHGFFIVTNYSKHVGDHRCCARFTRGLPRSAMVLATKYTGCHCGGLPLKSVGKVPHILSTKRYGSDCSLTMVTVGLGRMFKLGSVGRLPVVCGVT